MRILNGVFIVLFMAILALPLVFVDLSPQRVSVEENRMLAGRPGLASIKNHPEAFIRGFDAWFKDNTGFREQFIKLYKLIDRNAVARYTDGQYIYLIGENGHHYFAHTGGFLILKFQGKQFLSHERLTNMADKLEMVKTYLDGKNIPFTVMFCTDKESVYPEFYPKSIKRGPEPVQLDVITKYLQEHTSVDVFNIRQALLAEKDSYMLYGVSSGDLSHYNETGAFFAYRELMKHINIYFPDIVPYELNDVEINYKNGIPAEVSLKTETTYKRLDPSFFDDVGLHGSRMNEAYENTESELPVILCLRDSYFAERFIGKYIARHFGKTILINYGNIRRIDDYITRYRPDIVVFESAERELQGFADCVAGIPELP